MSKAIVSGPSYTIDIYLAGNRATAERVLNDYCYQHGCCVFVQEGTYIYTGGHEAGLKVTLINYQRFPKTPVELLTIAEQLVDVLLPALNQRSASMVAPDRTWWIQLNPTGAPSS